ncbi:MAG: L-histidine N(alpha)-methyltransferase [Syntrophotaleaceae bacterium]
MDFHLVAEKFTLRNYLADIPRAELVDTVLAGLKAPQKRISSLFLYDAVGSKLFEEITRLPEYYPTRTEKKLLRRFAPILAAESKACNIVEIGSGDCSKISILLGEIPSHRWHAVRYTPVDVSREAIRESAEDLQGKFPGIRIHGIVADFTRQLHHVPNGRNRLFCFLGGTLGNLSWEQNRQFFEDLGRVMQAEDALLLGVDMVKPVDILEKAYNDSQGVTAAFNRNILNVINRLVGTDFEPSSFEHLAFFNQTQSRIEMHLKATREMRISCPDLQEGIVIQEEETIHTENSHKYSPQDIEEFASIGGLQVKDCLTDENRWFSLIHFCKK